MKTVKYTVGNVEYEFDDIEIIFRVEDGESCYYVKGYRAGCFDRYQRDTIKIFFTPEKAWAFAEPLLKQLKEDDDE